MALSRNKKIKASDRHGSWFELVVFFFMSSTFYLIGALMNSSWTGERGQAIGEYLRIRGGGALIVPLLFLVYLCVAWFARSRIPRPLGQIFGTLQLYLSTAFILGLFRNAGGNLSWALSQPGRVGDALTQFFRLNLGILGTIFVAIVSLLLSAILFGFQFPLRFFHVLTARFMKGNVRERGKRGREARGREVIGREARAKEARAKEARAKEARAKEARAQETRLKENRVKENRERVRGRAPTTENTVSVPPLFLETSSLNVQAKSIQTASSAPFVQPTEVLESTPIDGMVIVGKDLVGKDLVGKDLIESNGYSSSESQSIAESKVPQDAKPFERETPDPETFEAESSEPNFPPPLDIFGPADKNDKNEDEEKEYDLANEQAKTIVETLQNFGVKSNVAHIVTGPSVVQFQLELAPGIKVSKVAGLANDLTMALAVVSVRVEAPILGQRYVGIEIPNTKRKGIALRSIIASEEFLDSEYALPMPMGVRVDSKRLVCGLEEMPHLLVAGTTGSGKSVFMNTCILGMCYRRGPDELKLILVDPKHVEFAIYDGLPHLLARPVSDPKKAIAALSWTVQEMENRSEAFAHAKVRNLASYNEKALPKNRFPHIVVVVDELADLMYTAGKEVEGLIVRLAQKARAAGIHLILATQRPSVDVITGLIKANVPARVAFAVPSQTDSRIIIDTGGAEKLLGKGDMLFYSTRYPRPIRLQASFITEERTLEFVESMKKIFGEPHYVEFEDFSGSGNSSGNENGGGDKSSARRSRSSMDTGIASASGL
ncbi:MAG: hypothetical protein LBJ36_07465 [Synergistaceae bacterium]|jgi:S-DNA-T family DNA segregation ATPase FtsK/SpoIIIE|nr:hypothetical protein [Synergistaceae bacterium]